MTTLKGLQAARDEMHESSRSFGELSLWFDRHEATLRTLLDETISKMEKVEQPSNSSGVDLDAVKRNACKALDNYPADIISVIDHLAAQGRILPEGWVGVDALTLQKAKCLIRFHVKEGACISIDDKTYNSLDIYSELNRLWITAAQKGGE